MARRGKKPEEYGQLSLFEEQEPEWLKPVEQLGYTITAPDGREDEDVPDSIFDRPADGAKGQAASADGDDELVQFAEWLSRKSGR